jgi:hypothetical protein
VGGENWVKLPVVVRRPIVLALSVFRTSDSENQNAPSGPAVIMEGCGATLNWVMACDVGSMRPILSPLISVNHRAPSGPETMSKGVLPAASPVENSVTTPPVVMRPILSVPASANHSAPSDPVVIS